MNPILACALGGVVGGVAATAGIGAWRRATGKPAPVGRARGRLGLVVSVFAVLGGRAGAMLNQPSIESQIDKANPEMSALHRYYPAQYGQIVEAVKTNGRAPDAIVKVQAVAVPLISQIIASHAREIDDANSRDLFQVVAEEASLVGARNPTACVNLVQGRPAGVDISQMLTPALAAEEREVSVRVLEQIATRPATPAAPLSQAQAKPLAVSAFSQLSPQQRQAVQPILANPALAWTDEQKTAYCAFAVKLIQTAIAGPPGTVRRLTATSR